MKIAIAMLKNLKKYAAMKNILFIIKYKTCEHNFFSTRKHIFEGRNKCHRKHLIMKARTTNAFMFVWTFCF